MTHQQRINSHPIPIKAQFLNCKMPNLRQAYDYADRLGLFNPTDQGRIVGQAASAALGGTSLSQQALKLAYRAATNKTEGRYGLPLRASNKKRKRLEVDDPLPFKAPRTEQQLAAKMPRVSVGRRPTRARRFNRRKISKKSFRRKRPRRTRKPFSTKGFRVIQLAKFGMDPNDTIKQSGFQDGSDFWDNYWAPYIDATTARPSCIPVLDTATNLCYARFKAPLSEFISANNMCSMFNKMKVNWISITFKFPDQQAQSTNSEFPLVLYVNHGDKWRTDIDGFGEEGPWDSAAQLLDRPGWKAYKLKRMNQFTLKFKPTMSKTREFQSSTTDVDVRKMIKSGWHDTDGTGVTSIHLFGPTIAFHMPHDIDATTQDFLAHFTGATASDYLQYSSIDFKASVSMHTPDNDGVNH